MYNLCGRHSHDTALFWDALVMQVARMDTLKRKELRAPLASRTARQQIAFYHIYYTFEL